MWYCPFCSPVMNLDANLERILAARPLPKVTSDERIFHRYPRLLKSSMWSEVSSPHVQALHEEVTACLIYDLLAALVGLNCGFPPPLPFPSRRRPRVQRRARTWSTS